MPEFCKYANCHNLASTNYQGYCSEEHRKKGPERDFLMKIIYTHKDIGTVKEAREHLKEAALTFFSHERSEGKEDVYIFFSL